jgi:hypothetical protein
MRTSIGRLLFSLLKLASHWLKPKVILTYLNTSKADGVGAQLQRILAIRSLSSSLNLGYLHTEVASLAIHPLDPYQDEAEMAAFLNKFNHEFWMESSKDLPLGEFCESETRVLSFAFLFSRIIKSKFSKKQILVKLVEPYTISEYDPNLYADICRFLPNLVLPTKTNVVLAIHYRRGVGGFAVQRGEKVSRELAGTYFATLAKEIIEANQLKDFKLVVFTDSPTDDVVFVPPGHQSHLWTTSTRFSDGEMHVMGLDLQEFFRDFSDPVEVVYGGDPLDVIKRLATADHLILSRSSFGYVAAVLNGKGKVYLPSQFWHVPMKSWRVVQESAYETRS